MSSQNRPDRMLTNIKNNKFISCLIVLGVIATALAQFTDSLSSLYSLIFKAGLSESKSMDLTVDAYKATWRSMKVRNLAGNVEKEENLPWMGDIDSELGYVRLETVKLEDGRTEKVLRTRPKQVHDGSIKGWFEWITVPANANANFRAQVGFAYGATKTDGVRFIVFAHYQKDGHEKWHQIAELTKEYTGKLLTIQADLSEFSGRELGIELRVDARNDPTHDWAVWLNPEIIIN